MANKITEKDKILVAGSGGMAGSAICRSLFKKGYLKLAKYYFEISWICDGKIYWKNFGNLENYLTSYL